MPPPEKTTSPSDAEQKQPAPSITLPKGGGAIRGIGEKFSANPVTGTGSMSVPIATSPGRSGFGPQLSLSYDSGAGNGPFGFGWSLSLPSITRKTDKGLPRYNDAADSDVFILSGSEDLVPEFEKDVRGDWIIVDGKHVIHEKTRTVEGVSYLVRRYRPRVEGLFARIERWTRKDSGDLHWRSISQDNVLTLYGKADDARIVDPDDPSRIFSWLICETRDDKGNGVLYEYKREDGVGVTLAHAHQRNRGVLDARSRTANRYIKRIVYGNRKPLLDPVGQRPVFLNDAQVQSADWMFEVVFDYGEHDAAVPKPKDPGAWSYRPDPFSTYRAGFEVRTARRCKRVLMFHHFPTEPEVGNDCLVRSTEFKYSDELKPADVRNPVYTFMAAVSQSGHRRKDAGYLSRSLPPVEFEYTQPVIQDTVEEVDPESLENLPIGVDGTAYQWIDLHGEGIPGILAEQADVWWYKRNLSPLGQKPVDFGPLELVGAKPNLSLTVGAAQFMDLAGDGQPDVVVLEGSMAGLYEHDEAEGWDSFRPFRSPLNREMRDPNLKFVDLDGDGHADVLITEDEAFVWHASLAEEGFGPAQRVAQSLDEEQGPRVVFADGTQSIHLADLSGDGLTDIVRVRNSEVCYWPNLGYGRFGMKVTMDDAPTFDQPDQFDHKRIRLADIDGTGTTDLIYLHRDGVRLYFNQSGNSWSEPTTLKVSPRVDDLTSIVPTDLLGNGTACLVWSSSLPGEARRPMRYVNLMGSQKPHLLVKTENNLGAETRVFYAPSTKFYLRDKRDGKPWVTRLPFPVHVIERVETYDHISRNRFVTRHAYHHGYFDGEEREFRGFGMVEDWDSEEFALPADDTSPPVANAVTASHVSAVHTKTWFHTGAYIGRDNVSNYFAGMLDADDKGEYYREPGLDDVAAGTRLLDDSVLPPGLTIEEQREACRALKGSILRRELYADDAPPGSPDEIVRRAKTPYTVAEQNLSVRCEQPFGENRHGVFVTHPRESITYHYERNPADPRIQHSLTLDVDPYGQVSREASIAYGRLQADATLPTDADRRQQARTLVLYTDNRFTNAIDDFAKHPDDYRTPHSSETLTYQVTGAVPELGAARFTFEQWARDAFRMIATATEIQYEDEADEVKTQRRLIEHIRTLYRPDDLGVSAGGDPTRLLKLGILERRGIAGEAYKLAFTPGLLANVFRRNDQALLLQPADVLGGQASDRGGYLLSQQLKAEGRFPNSDPDGLWWVPAGRIFVSPERADGAAAELAYGRDHFFLSHRFQNPFGHTTRISYDINDLLLVETLDAVGNRVTVGERRLDGTIDGTKPGNDYRVLQPRLVMDQNRNRAEAAYDALGMVVGTALRGKPEENLGDTLAGFVNDLTETDLLEHLTRPLVAPQDILNRATTRLVYDSFAYHRTKTQSEPAPVAVYTLARETHDADVEPGQVTKYQHSFSYSDGFAREIQRKNQAEAGPLVDGGPIVSPRWIGSGWTVFNNKGQPYKRFEPFATATHEFEFGLEVGVSTVLFYDPLDRVVATLHPNHTYEKLRFDAWQLSTYDVNDTVGPRNMQTGDPRTDPDIEGLVAEYFDGLASIVGQPWQTWFQLRQGGALGVLEQSAATKALAHADTPKTDHFDALGRKFMTVVRNRVTCAGHPLDGTEAAFTTRFELDIEGNQRTVRDAVVESGDNEGRIVTRYAYDMLGCLIFQVSMDAGLRWMLNDVLGKPIRIWNGRKLDVRHANDPLGRPLRTFVRGADPTRPGDELLTERLVYGEQHPESESRNLRGRLHLHLDQAGAAATETEDFKGNQTRVSRRIAIEYRTAIDWTGIEVTLPADATTQFDSDALAQSLSPAVEADAYESTTVYDALNRAIFATTPHTPAMSASAIRRRYNEANLVEGIDANLSGAVVDGALAWTPFVTNIDYDAKGQRVRVDLGNGASTFYVYDPLTYRLMSLRTRRNVGAFPDDSPQPPPVGWPGSGLQSLEYTYDPAGNILHVRDDAQQTIFFRNKRVEPNAEYTYDALYRLIEATGREHLGQIPSPPIPHSHDDILRVGIDWAAKDGNAMGSYRERYVYDAAGNIASMRHIGSDPVHPGWTRTYAYLEVSLNEDGTGATALKHSNRLSSTTIGNGAPSIDRYAYDSHGNMVHIAHLGGIHPQPNMYWDDRDRLRKADLGGGNTAYFTYAADGQRVRKVWEEGPATTRERLYLGGFEIFRRRMGANELERETLQVMADDELVALVDTRTVDTAGNDAGPARLTRYQIADHHGSVGAELSEAAQLISYEEYSPYGSTVYHTTNVAIAKRYRYTAKERDEETGLYYVGAREYIPWLGRWASTDPSGLVDGVNKYQYAQSSPIVRTDTSGRWSWGKTLGLVAAVAVGVAVTALTGGIAGPIVAGIIGGALAGATGEIVEAAVDGRPITAGNVIGAAVVGAALGGVFAKAGQVLARSEVVKRAVAGVLARPGVQKLGVALYRAAASKGPVASVVRGGAQGVRKGIEALEKVGEAAGRRLGGKFAENAARQAEARAGVAAANADAAAVSGGKGVGAAMKGELDGQPFAASTIPGKAPIETPGGPVKAPGADEVANVLTPHAVPRVSGGDGIPFPRNLDAEFKLFGHALGKSQRDTTGRLYMGVAGADMCPSCYANLWATRAALPGVDVMTSTSLHLSGAAGAAQTLLPKDEGKQPEMAPVLQLQINF